MRVVKQTIKEVAGDDVLNNSTRIKKARGERFSAIVDTMGRNSLFFI